ncbi:MAG: YkgJ family cysteine cluster protein [Phycisphaerae bacterium]|nr:YkgJ family cysteine cluster protein [Phycisphaerae bacterium]
MPIETPDTPAEFDDIRWYLIHDAVTVFVEDGEWYISFHTPCRHLLADNRCGIYETRPRICRKYTTDNCDYHSGDYGWEYHFTSPEHIDEYLRASKAKSRSAKRSVQPKRSRARIAAGRGLGRRSRGPQVDRFGIPLPELPEMTQPK